MRAMAAEAVLEAKKDGKLLVGNYSLRGLALAWDNRSAIRDRLREQKRLLLQYDTKLKQTMVAKSVDKSVYNIRINQAVLSPVLHLVRANRQLQPGLDRLIEEIKILYAKYKIDILGDIVYHEAWSIRHLLSLLKNEHCRVLADFKKGHPKRKCKDHGARKASKQSPWVSIFFSQPPFRIL